MISYRMYFRVETEIDAPSYLKTIANANQYRLVQKDGHISPLVQLSSRRPDNENSSLISADDGYNDNWLTAEQLGFNKSQHEAFKNALTHEFVVIQG